MTAEIELIAKATVILGLALVATRIACRSRASVRALILSSAFGLMLVMPIASAITPAREVEIPAAIAPAFFEDQPVPTPGDTVDLPLPATDAEALPLFQLPLMRTLARGAWLLGTVIAVLPLAAGLWRVRTIRCRGRRWAAGNAAVNELSVPLGLRRAVTVILHDGIATPVTCGWMRPTIVMPVDAPEGSAGNIRQALLHELEHVRRHDWPVHVLARLTCALYWFHPATWIAWRQLSLDSERACDDAVVSRAESTAYAAQLVTLARRAATGRADLLLSMADRRTLVTRVASILSTSIARGRAGFVSVAAIVVAAIAVSAALFPLQARARVQSVFGLDASVDPKLQFGVASVRPNDGSDPSRGFGFTLESGRLRLRNQSLRTIISVAYAPTFSLFFPDERISGGPEWMNTGRFTIDARAERAVTGREMSQMLRNLLAQRFNLKVRIETREAPVYALVLAKRDRTLGPQLKALTTECVGGRCGIGGGAGRYMLTGAPMALLADSLSELVGRPVYDRTNLPGSFEGTLTWAPTPEEIGALGEPARAPEFGVSLFTALEEQFGLKLQPERGGVDYLVVERAEQPTPNDAPDTPAQANPAFPRPREAFEVASIRRNTSSQPRQTITQRGNTFVAENITTRDLVMTAFGMKAEHLSGGPGWLDSERYDVSGRPAREAAWEEQLVMLQMLLVDRFRLVLRSEKRDR